MVVMFRKTASIFFFASIVLTTNAFAQQQKKYSLEDFVDSAERHMPVLLQKQALLDASKAGITDAKHSFLPNAFVADQLALGTDNSIPGSYLSYGIIPSTSSGVRPS